MKSICTDGPQVFQAQETEIACLRANRAANQVVDCLRQYDPPWLYVFLQSRRDIDAVPINVVSRRHHIANVDGNTQRHRAQIGALGSLRPMHLVLDIASPFDSVESARELREDP